MPGNNTQAGWEGVGGLGQKWSLQHRQAKKSQTEGYVGVRVTVLIQKPVAGSGKASGGLRDRSNEGCDANSNVITSDTYVTPDNCWGHPSSFTLAALGLFLLVVEKKWVKIREATHFANGNTTRKQKENQTFIEASLSANDSTGSIMSGDSKLKEETRRSSKTNAR